jgi:exosortase
MPGEEKTNNGSALETIRTDFVTFWQAMPVKVVFFILLAAWVVLFQFLGNSTLGYIQTPSLFAWMKYVYTGSPDDEHGMLIPLAVLALFWWKRQELVSVPKRIWWPALAVVVFALLMHILGYTVQVPQVSVIAFFVGIYGLMGLTWGWAWLQASFFPMILFAFCVPISSLGEPITVPLRLLATNITTFLCGSILQIDLIQKGNLVFDSTQSFQYEIAAACGGIRSLISMLALTTIFGFVVFKSNWRRALMILSAFPLAVAGNVFRLSAIIVAAEAFGQKSGDFVHDKLGLLPYVPALAGIMLLGYWLREEAPRETSHLEANAT